MDLGGDGGCQQLPTKCLLVWHDAANAIDGISLEYQTYVDRKNSKVHSHSKTLKLLEAHELEGAAYNCHCNCALVSCYK